MNSPFISNIPYLLCFLLIWLALRENDLEYKEKDNHGDTAGNKCYKKIVDRRRHICRCDRHPQVVESVADQRDHNPCDKIPHCLINRIAFALERNISLEREIDALRQEGSHLIADEVSEAASDHDCSARISYNVVSQQTPGKRYSKKFQIHLRPHKLSSRKPLSQYMKHDRKYKILKDRYTHTEYKEVKDLINPFCQLWMLLFKTSPCIHPSFLDTVHNTSSILLI